MPQKTMGEEDSRHKNLCNEMGEKEKSKTLKIGGRRGHVKTQRLRVDLSHCSQPDCLGSISSSAIWRLSEFHQVT